MFLHRDGTLVVRLNVFTSTSHLWLTILSFFVLFLSILLILVIISMAYIKKRATVYLL